MQHNAGSVDDAQFADAAPDSRLVGHRSVRALRLAVAFHSGIVFLQPVFAGLYMAGNFDALKLHEVNANLVGLLGIAQFVTALLYWRPGGGRLWPAAVT